MFNPYLAERVTRSSKVNALIQDHGWPVEEACEAMRINPADYLPDVLPARMPEHMPRATEIETTAAATALLDHTDRRHTKKYLDPRVIREQHPADIVPGIGDREWTVDSETDDPAIDQFREFLRSKRR